MLRIDHLPLIGKFLIVLAMFGIVALSSVVFSTWKMRQIDDGYGIAIGHQGRAARLLTEATQSLYGAKSAMTDLQISNTDEGNQRAVADLSAQERSFREAMAKASAADLPRAYMIAALTERGLTIFNKTCAKALAMGAAATKPAELVAAQAEHLLSCAPAYPSLIQDVAQLARSATADENKTDDDLTNVTNSTITTTYIVVIGGIALVMTIGFFAIGHWVSAPVRNLVGMMERLAGGDFEANVVGGDRRDEIGAMARTLLVFKDNGVKLKQTEAGAAQARQAADQARAANEAARAEIQRKQEAVVAAIAGGLDRLSKGDLTGRLNQAFSTEYEKLRADFNGTTRSLQEALGTIYAATNGITSGSEQIAHASDDLARRTEQQAASLEETAASLNLITDTVKTMASNAGRAATVVLATRGSAESSGAIVEQAVDAMSKIQDSSRQISNIIGVIDEIAFQTNLLALNAGVEAARAGEAGRGFAVVASEVRALAQRSAEAAKEIKTLISASTLQVESGVVLVDKTGAALKDIITKITEMDGLVREISSAAQEQSTSIAEINIAVRQMDQVVQQNAAMVEESTAAAHTLKSDTQSLSTMVGRFQLDDGGQGRHLTIKHEPSARLTPAPVSKPRPIRKAMGASATASANDDWQSFKGAS